MSVILYSTGCPKCEVLKDKLADKGIKYTENNDRDLMISLGFSQIPILEVDSKRMDFSDANKWINEQ